MIMNDRSHSKSEHDKSRYGTSEQGLAELELAAPAADPNVSSLEPDAKRSREYLQALERGLAALSFLNRFGAGTSSQVAKALGLKRSTAHRILAVLVDLGLLRHDTFNHQYILSARVGELSSGFHDDDWVSAAVPRMKAWTREHHWPLVLATPLAGKLVVRASTDYESPISIDRFHGGQVIPVQGSTAGLLYMAYVGGAAMPAKSGREPAADDAVKTATPEDLARIRTAGFVARPTACFTGARISIPLREEGPFLGCITMRCRAGNIEVMSEVHTWVQLLRRLANDIGSGIRPAMAPQ
jgi:IclR family mhp operon transcriptional activator